MENNGSNSDLVFNVAQLLKERVGATRRLQLETPELVLDEGTEDGGRLEAHKLHGDVKVTRLSEGLLVQGDIEADVTMECSRCLTELNLPVDASLEEQFQPTVDIVTGMPVHRAEYEDDQAFEIDPNHLMDLSEPVRQALLVALPMKPLCREDCKGICPECGANLNEVDCGHTSEPEDNRWSGLAVLRIEDFPAGSAN